MTAEDADDLRRRLYRPDATEEDLVRYETAASRAPEPPPVEEAVAQDDPPAPQPRRRGRRLVPVAIVALCVGAVAVGVLAGGPAHVHRRAPSADPGVQTLAVTAVERSVLVRGLDRGGDAGIGAYFFSHIEVRPPILQMPGRTETSEFHGRGSGTVALRPSSAALHGGRMTVVLVVGGRAEAGWRADRLATPDGRPATWQPVAARTAEQAAGVPTVATIDYLAPPPTRLAVRTPAGVRWGVAVVYTD